MRKVPATVEKHMTSYHHALPSEADQLMTLERHVLCVPRELHSWFTCVFKEVEVMDELWIPSGLIMAPVPSLPSMDNT